jgi:hypothetical protein
MDPFELPAGVPLAAEIEFYAGGRAEERPVRIRLRGASLEVEQVMARWRTPEGAGFRVRAGGLVVVLREDAGLGLWTAEICGRAPGSG